MKFILTCTGFAAVTSLLATCSLFGQAASSTLAPSTPALNQPAGEKAEDAALLQQLDSSSAPAEKTSKRKNVWAAGGRGGGAVSVAPGAAPFRGQNLLAHPFGAPKALLVRTSEGDPKSQAALEEDLAVMGHLLVKAIDELPGGQPRSMNALGIELAFPGGPSPVRSLYLDNYGALFFLNVGFPLIAPPEKQPEEKPTADSAWEDARQELYGQRLQGAGVGEPAEDYNQEKVDRLKETLLEALKNATNIRELKGDEFVTVWVGGGVAGLTGRFHVLKNNTPGALGGNFVAADQPSPVSKRTSLTIRVSKTDIDAYAKGKLTSEDFRKHARITTYSEDAGSGPSDVLIYSGKARF